jgi:hypothetical protein
MRILTGNDLVTGDVVWWTGSDWSRHVEDAVDVGEAGERIGREEEAARRVNVPYVIDAEATPDGPRPAHIRTASARSAPRCAPTSRSSPPILRREAG